ncbi:hypothetical protein BROUX41_002890 [Berkeleyomyces rouxiae]|uniref:uncharacterized protein n=1 Tax=Berkeleyomyces rouxiae TaxID=2035830 RepID=UPI003B7FEEA9
MFASKTAPPALRALGSSALSRPAAAKMTPCKAASSFSTSAALLTLRGTVPATPGALRQPLSASSALVQPKMQTQTRALSFTSHMYSAGVAAPPSSSSTVLDWNSFFKLRKARRRWQLLFSAAGFVGCGMTGAVMLANGVGGELLTQVPLDPMITMGLVTTSAASLGWLMGPSLGSRVFYWLNRQVTPQFMLKENNFFARIKRNRVDPSSSSAGNPVPDFYGEKISSVTGYRHWLKDQRAFNKKRTSFV